MGLLNWFPQFTGYAKSSLNTLIAMIGEQVVYTPINQEKAITLGFKGNTAVYSIVMKDATKFGSIPRYVYDAKKKEEKAYNDNEYVLTNDLSKLLLRPNEYQGQDAFFTAVRAFYKICGESFIWLNRGDLEAYRNPNGSFNDDVIDRLPVLEMYVLPSNHVEVISDKENLWGVIGYQLDVTGRKVPIRKNDVIHWKNVNLDFDAVTRPHLRGMPPLTPGYRTLQQNNDATDSSVRMYQNDGSKGALTNETLDKLKPEQESQLRRIVDAKINNNDVKGAVAMLQGKWAYLNFGGTSVDLQLLEGKELSWKELCFLFEVPYEFFDSHTPYAEKQLAQVGWLTNAIIPASKQLDDELNRILLRAFKLENVAFIACDYSELPEMQQDLGKMVLALKDAWWITPNEKREMMMEEPRDEPEFDEPWVPTGYQPLSQLAGDGFDQMQAQLDQLKLNGQSGQTSNGKVSSNGTGKNVRAGA